jgi:hypothetical protein
MTFKTDDPLLELERLNDPSQIDMEQVAPSTLVEDLRALRRQQNFLAERIQGIASVLAKTAKAVFDTNKRVYSVPQHEVKTVLGQVKQTQQSLQEPLQPLRLEEHSSKVGEMSNEEIDNEIMILKRRAAVLRVTRRRRKLKHD